MKLNQNIKLSIRIILLFSVAIFSTFIPESFPEFFGDWMCEGSKYGKIIKATEATWEHYEKVGCDYVSSIHNPTLHWGYRHYLYLVMCLVLFIIQVNDIIKSNDTPTT